jgi:hypothetical protein
MLLCYRVESQLLYAICWSDLVCCCDPGTYTWHRIHQEDWLTQQRFVLQELVVLCSWSVCVLITCVNWTCSECCEKILLSHSSVSENWENVLSALCESLCCWLISFMWELVSSYFVTSKCVINFQFLHRNLTKHVWQKLIYMNCDAFFVG